MDLAQRLDLFCVVVPPLRTWGEDIDVWAQTRLERLKGEYGGSAKSIHPDGLAALRGHPWPGNLPELDNELIRALVFETGKELRFEHLRGACRDACEVSSSSGLAESGIRVPTGELHAGIGDRPVGGAGAQTHAQQCDRRGPAAGRESRPASIPAVDDTAQPTRRY